MSIRKLLFAALVVASLVGGCENAPIPNTPHDGYPCGYIAHSCGHKMCCPNDADCGGTPSCGAGLCCYAGNGNLGARQATPQRPEASQ